MDTSRKSGFSESEQEVPRKVLKSEVVKSRLVTTEVVKIEGARDSGVIPCLD